MDSVGSSEATRDQGLAGGPAAAPQPYFPVSFGRGGRLQASPNQEHTMKDFEMQITDLKKENFNLKLRIYFLEEQIQKTYCAGRDEVHRLNVELKVEVESLKHELDEKQRLLYKASKAVESLTGSSAEIRPERGRHGKEDEAAEFLSRKIRLLEGELETRNTEVDKIGALLEQERTRRFDTEEKLSAVEKRCAKTVAVLAEKDWVIEHLNGTLGSKESTIAKLKQQLSTKPMSPAEDPESLGSMDASKGEKTEEKEPGFTNIVYALNGDCQLNRQLANQPTSVDDQGRPEDHFDATKGKETAEEEPGYGHFVVTLVEERQPNQQPTSEERSGSPDSLDATEGNETEEKELDYRQLISTLKEEKERFLQMVKSMQESRNPEKDLDAYAELRRQLLENIQANQELSKILEGLIRAHCSYNDTISFLGDQTSYLSICLDHLNQNVEFPFEESHDNPSKVDLARTHRSSYQHQVVTKETACHESHNLLEIRNTLAMTPEEEHYRETQVAHQDLEIFERENNDSFNRSNTLVESISECTLTPQKVMFSDLNVSYNKLDIMSKSIGIQVEDIMSKSIGIQVEVEDLKETLDLLPISNTQVDGSLNVQELKTSVKESGDDNHLLLDIGKTAEYLQSSHLVPKERKCGQNRRKLYKNAKKSRLPVLLKSSTGTQLHEAAQSSLPGIRDDLKLQEDLQRYRGQVEKLTEDLHQAFNEIQKYKNDVILLKEHSFEEQHSDYSAGGSSHTPSRLVPGCRLWLDKNGRHVLGLLEDYDALQKQIVEGMGVLQEIEICFDDSTVLKAMGDFGSVMYEKVRRTMQSLEAALRLMNLLWRVSLPSHVSEPHGPRKDEEVRLENGRFLSTNAYEQNQFSSGITNRFYSENQLEDSMKLILQQVSLTHEVLQKARRNLERQPANTQH